MKKPGCGCGERQVAVATALRCRGYNQKEIRIGSKEHTGKGESSLSKGSGSIMLLDPIPQKNRLA